MFTAGCVALGTGQARKALLAYQGAVQRFERLGQLRYAALTATYSVEPHCILGRRDLAATTVAQWPALREGWLFGTAAGCRPKITSLFLRLRLAEEIDAGETASVDVGLGLHVLLLAILEVVRLVIG